MKSFSSPYWRLWTQLGANAFCLACLTFCVNAQPPNFRWAVEGIGNGGYDSAGGVAADHAGNTYITGGINSSLVSFGGEILTANLPNPSLSDPPYGTAFFLGKLDPSGNMLWVRQAGAQDAAMGFACATDSTGDVYVAGAFSSTNLNLAGTIFTNAGQINLFVAKFNPSRDLLWARQE